jgi:putative transposase
LAVPGANRPDGKLVEETLESIPVERPKPTDAAPQNLCLDNGYNYAEPKQIVEEFRFTAHLPKDPREAQAVKRRARRKARRWVVERTHSWMNRFRGILIRWNKKPQNYIAMLHFAFALITYRCMGLFG